MTELLEAVYRGDRARVEELLAADPELRAGLAESGNQILSDFTLTFMWATRVALAISSRM